MPSPNYPPSASTAATSFLGIPWNGTRTFCARNGNENPIVAFLENDNLIFFSWIFFSISGCKYSRIGCPWRGPLHESKQHELECPHPHKSGAEVMETLQILDQQLVEERHLYDNIFELLGYEKITFNGIFYLYFQYFPLESISENNLKNTFQIYNWNRTVLTNSCTGCFTKRPDSLRSTTNGWWRHGSTTAKRIPLRVLKGTWPIRFVSTNIYSRTADFTCVTYEDCATHLSSIGVTLMTFLLKMTASTDDGNASVGLWFFFKRES